MADPQGALLGNAHGYVDIDVSGVGRNLDLAKQQFGGFIQQTVSMMQSWGSQIASFGQNLTLWTAPVALAVGAGLNVAADFDSVLTEIQARTGLTAEAMEQVRQTALQLGADTAFSSQQAADAFLNLLTAGLSVEDALATLPNVLTAAAAGSMDLGTAADLTTSIMASFNLSAQDSTAIIDAMSRASAASPASMNEIGIAMKDVGGLAQMFNLSLDETAAVLAIFAQNGIRGAEAGTQLRSLLLNLSSPTAATQAAWDALGTSLYNADGTMRNLDDVLADIRVGLDRLPVEQQNEIISQLAGSYGIVGFNALLASDGIGAMEASMAEQAAASEVAAAMMDTFRGVVDAFKGSMETLWITVMTPYMNNVLKPMIERKTEMVNAITAWAAANEPLVQTIMQIVSAVLTLGPILIGVGIAMQVIGGALVTIGTVAAFALSPITLLIAGVAGLAFVFRNQLWTAISGTIRPITDMFAAIGAGVPILDVFQHFLYDIAGLQVAATFGEMRQGLTDFIAKIKIGMQFFSLYINRGASVVTALRVTLGALFGSNPVAAGFLTGIFEAIDQFSIALKTINIGVIKFFDALRTPLDKFLLGVRLAFNAFFGLLSNGVSPLIALQSAIARTFGGESGISRFVNIAVSKFVEFRNAVSGTLDFLQGAWFRFSNVFGYNMRNGESAVVSFQNALRVAFNNSDFINGAIDSFNGLSATISKVFERIMNAVQPALEQISVFFQKNQARVWQFIQGFMAITQLFNPIGQLSLLLRFFGLDFMTVFETIMGGITRFFETMNEGGKASDALKAAFGDSGGVFDGLFGIITNQVMPALEQLRAWFLDTVAPNIGAFITNSLIPNIVSLLNILGNIWSIVGPPLMEFGGWFIMTGMPGIMQALERFSSYLANDLDVGEGMRAIVDWFLNTALPPIMAFINGTAIPGIQSFITWLGNIWSQAQPALNSLGNWFLNDVMPQINGIIQNSLLPLLADFGSFLSDVWLLAQPHLQNLADWFLITGLPGIQNFITTAILPAVEGFIGLLQRIWTDVEPHLTNLATWFFAPGGALDGIINFLQTTIPTVFNGFITLLSDIWTIASPYLENLWNWFMAPDGALQGIATWLSTDVAEIFGNFTDLIAGIWDLVSPGLGSFYNWFMAPGGGLQAIMEFLQGAFTLAIQGITTMIQDMVGFINDAITAAGDLMGIQVGTTSQVGGGGYQAHLNTVVGGAASGVLGKIAGFASGIDFVPQDMIAMIHAGERVQRASENPFNSNAQTNGMGGGIDLSGAQFVFPGVRTRDEAADAADSFGARLKSVMQERDF